MNDELWEGEMMFDVVGFDLRFFGRLMLLLLIQLQRCSMLSLFFLRPSFCAHPSSPLLLLLFHPLLPRLQNNRLSGDIAHSLATIYPDGNALMTIRRNYGGVAEGCVPPEKEVRKRMYYYYYSLM